jgi:hypothetical protein
MTGWFMYICRVPESLVEFKKLIDVERAIFGGHALSFEASLALFKKRPDIYTAVFSPIGSVAAYLTTYPLQPRYAEAVIEGEVTEPELTPDMLSAQHRKLDGSCIYIGSVFVDRELNPLFKAILIISLAQYHIRKQQANEFRRFSVIMTTASKEGERLTNWIGAQKLNDGCNRKDGLDVYGRTISRGFLYHSCATMERLLENKYVRIDFASPPLNVGLIGVEARHVEASHRESVSR